MAITTGANVPTVTSEDIEAARQIYIAKRGRPSKFCPEIASEICLRLEEGETITSICRDARMPHISSVNDWRGNIPQFAAEFTRARLRSGSALVDGGRDKIDGLAVQKFDAGGNPIKLSMTDIRLAEIQFKAGLEVAKSYDREQFGANVQVSSIVTVETMDQRLARLTGQPITIPAEFAHVIEHKEG